eukprot:m.267192 g.267192  ORF g.267192 m.267192 type:complete len:148 (+) comp19726_c0_seq5:567-1010(+)
MPTPTSLLTSAAKDAPPMFWSMDIGFVHVISLNTDTYLLGSTMASTQYDALQQQLQWLEADLKSAAQRRHTVPWIIAFGHEMLYSTHDSGHVSQASILRNGGNATHGPFGGLEHLFHTYGVHKNTPETIICVLRIVLLPILAHWGTM